MKNRFFLALAAALSVAGLFAQDPRERVYNYEVLHPSHEQKPPVTGYAAVRVGERLDRGLTVQPARDTTGVYLSWRMLAADHPEVGFNVYRRIAGRTELLDRRPVSKTTDYLDATLPAGVEAEYWVEPCYNLESGPACEPVAIVCDTLRQAPRYRSIRLRDNERAGKVALADLNGDGKYDFIVRTPDRNVDPGMPGDPMGLTYTISAYLHDGTHLWSRDLGPGIEPGIWYSPFVAYDFDGDGKAEVALKTAPADARRNARHRVDSGEEYLSVLDGMTGEELARVDWPERSWRLGDLNRQNRNQLGMAFLDGRTPCIIAARGTYRAMLADAWQFHDGRLTRLWRWDGDEENPVIRSQGAHSMVTGDVDGDGRDEILLGGCMLDDNGTLLWSAGIGHPDKAYLADIDPARPGLEVFLCGEVRHDDGRGVCMVDAATGRQVWNIGRPTRHVGDGMVVDFDPSHPGMECIGKEDRKGGSTARYLLTAQGEELLPEAVPDCRNWVWWDADLLRETFRGRRDTQCVVEWPDRVLAEGIEGSIVMIADILGDWREEIVTALPGELRIYMTDIPAADRRPALMQDPLYRSYVLHRSMGYPQVPVPSYYLGK